MAGEVVEDLYALLGLQSDATEKAINKAYRKLALKYHPDKKSGNEEMFIRINKAAQLLTDKKLKAEYDEKLTQYVKTKKRMVEKTQMMDAKRRKMREDLMKREKAATDTSASSASRKAQNQKFSEQKRRQAELNRLREENEARVRAAAAKKGEDWVGMAEQFRQAQTEKAKAQHDQSTDGAQTRGEAQAQDEKLCSLRVKWKRKKESHSDDTLAAIFKKYGAIREVLLGKKGSSAVILFESAEAALSALKHENENDRWKELRIVGDHMAASRLWTEPSTSATSEPPRGPRDDRGRGIFSDFLRKQGTHAGGVPTKGLFAAAGPGPAGVHTPTTTHNSTGAHTTTRARSASEHQSFEEEIMKQMMAAGAARKQNYATNPHDDKQQNGDQC